MEFSITFVVMLIIQILLSLIFIIDSKLEFVDRELPRYNNMTTYEIYTYIRLRMNTLFLNPTFIIAIYYYFWNKKYIDYMYIHLGILYLLVFIFILYNILTKK